jgi:hypothetical protein
MAIAIALPVAVVGRRVLDDHGGGGLVLAFLLPVLTGFAVGGYIAARQAPSAPLAHGALAALGAFALVQGIGTVRRLVAGEALSLPSLALAAFVACCCGLLGGMAAQRQPIDHGGDDGRLGDQPW